MARQKMTMMMWGQNMFSFSESLEYIAQEIKAVMQMGKSLVWTYSIYRLGTYIGVLQIQTSHSGYCFNAYISAADDCISVRGSSTDPLQIAFDMGRAIEKNR